MRILLVPELRPGYGTGHLRRSLRLLRAFHDAALLVDRDHHHGALLADVDPRRIVSSVDGAWERIVVDRFSTSASEVLALRAHGLAIGIDAGGEGRRWFDYLIDTLPRIDGAPANLHDIGLLELPRRAEPCRDDGPILVTFGGEDPAHLTERVVASLVRAGYGPRVRAVSPGARTLAPLPEIVTLLDPQPSLEPEIRDASVVVTSFGLTAMEASAAGRAVVTVAPTRYHDRLARRVGFARAGRRNVRSRRLRRAIEAGRLVTIESSRRSVAAVIGDLPLPQTSGCPVHPDARGEVIWRNETRSYTVCPVCGLIGMERFARDQESYGREYFLQEYARQYGRTYLDDFKHIQALGDVRVRHAMSVCRGGARTVLDIGCAYGPFLSAAKNAGLVPHGVDIADDAVRHVREELGMRAVAGDVRELDVASVFGPAQFDIVTMWYVIEHFPRLDTLLATLSSLVRSGGVLALGTPHARGVSARRTRDAFFEASPRDHFSIWDSRSARKALREYGFRVRRIVVTGHHPERYPLVARGLMPWWAAVMHSRLFGRGDTFEIYAVRE